MEKMTKPCPRLEFYWVRTGKTWYNRECIYSLVLPLGGHDTRRQDENGRCIRTELKLEIGSTYVSGGDGNPPIDANGLVDTPFRDGAHAKWDREAIGADLPIVAVCGDVFSTCNWLMTSD